MTFLALIRLYLRRYRLLFLVLLVAVLVHEIGFIFLFELWKKQVQLGDLLLGLIPAKIRTGIGLPNLDLTDPRTYKALLYLRPESRLMTTIFGKNSLRCDGS